MGFRESSAPVEALVNELDLDNETDKAKEKESPLILTICMGGTDRSRVIAEELRKRGYDSWNRGIRSFTNRLTQEDIDRANHIIVVGDRVLEEVEEQFDLSGKKIDFLELIESIHSTKIKRGGEHEESVRELIREDLDLLDLVDQQEEIEPIPA